MITLPIPVITMDRSGWSRCSDLGGHDGPKRADLVRSKTHVLVTWASPATLAATRATSTVPIVMVSVGDPVRAELGSSFPTRCS